MRIHEEKLKEIMKIEDYAKRQEALLAYQSTDEYKNSKANQTASNLFVGGAMTLAFVIATFYIVVKILMFLIKV